MFARLIKNFWFLCIVMLDKYWELSVEYNL